MKEILTAPFMIEAVRMCTNMYAHGWDERNGGNLSILLDEAEVGEYLDLADVQRVIPAGFAAPELAGKYFLVTGTGKYFKTRLNIQKCCTSVILVCYNISVIIKVCLIVRENIIAYLYITGLLLILIVFIHIMLHYWRIVNIMSMKSKAEIEMDFSRAINQAQELEEVAGELTSIATSNVDEMLDLLRFCSV